MENKTGRNGFVDVGIVVLAILLFFRTADVLSYFAPGYINNLIGTDVSWLYAGVMAFFVEGLAVAYHFDRRTKHYTRAKIAMWTLIGISALCQMFDGNIITNNLANMGGPLKTTFQYGVPLLPIFIFVLLAWVGGMPEIGESRSWLERFQDRGIKGRLPSAKAILYGRENTEFPPSQVVQSNLNVPQQNPPLPTPANGKNSGVANPTNRQP